MKVALLTCADCQTNRGIRLQVFGLQWSVPKDYAAVHVDALTGDVAGVL